VTSSAVVGSSAIRSFGLVGERHGDHHALPLAAGELVRISLSAASQAHGMPTWFKQLQVRARRLPQSLVQIEDLADLPFSIGVQRIERRHRLLEDHRDVVAAHLPQHLIGGLQQVMPAKENFSGGMAAAG
jgi:LmbE family N-acetylglucosaminyl deacetylase